MQTLLKQKSNILVPVFRFCAYSIFVILMLCTDHAFGVSDSKLVAGFILFSATFELLISQVKVKCYKVFETIIVAFIVLVGLTLIRQSESVCPAHSDIQIIQVSSQK